MENSEEASAGRAPKPSAKYMAKAKALARAIEIGMPLYSTSGVEEDPRDTLRTMMSWSDMALNPRPAFANLKSLAYLESAYFTYWNEAPCEAHVKMFWERVASEGLPFKRRDVVRELLERGRIRSDLEYEYANDLIPGHRQLGILTDDEETRIAGMIEAYENRAASRPRKG
jgi:hypothetical protein